MSLREQKGNMYDFVTHTWNPIKGKCSHDCSYCYMKRFPQNKLRLDLKEMNTDLGENNFIFVGSGNNNLPEPDKKTLEMFIKRIKLNSDIKIHLKKNINRIL